MRGDGTPKTYNEAVYQVVHRSAIEPKEIADRLGLGTSTLYNAANPDMDEPQLCHKHIIPITNLTDNFAILDYMEHACGRVAFEIPHIKGNFSEVVGEVSLLTQEFSKLLKDVSEDLADNGRIDMTGLEKITLDCLTLISELARFQKIAAMEAERK